MKIDCDVIRDLLPLYADEACSEKSRELVSAHLQDCPSCREMLQKLKETEIEEDLQVEKNSVIQYGVKRFKRRSAAVGSGIAGAFMIPILVCLVINIAFGPSLGWFFIVLAALGVAASLIIVPLTVPRDKAFWTFCAFCVSLVVLLGVICLSTGGNWFWIASSASLFGLGVIFLPFVIKAQPVQRLIGESNRALIVLGLDGVLFLNMMNMISARLRNTLSAALLTVGALAGIVLIASEIIRKKGK